ncbi:MAG TPA: hypothetical protein ENN44_05900 [Methanoculleus sp.]|nr:hypothetical protein [Methanoculleus sp.]
MTHQDGEWNLRDINIPGLVGGMLIFALPFMGAWWQVRFGITAFVLDLSPFTVATSQYGTPIASPVLSVLSLAFMVLILYFAALLVAGSILRANPRYRTLSDWLVRWSARKPLYLIIFFVLSLVITSLAMDYSLGKAGIVMSLPIVIGEAVGTISVSGLAVTIPATMELTMAFGIAVVISVIAVLAEPCQARRRQEDTEED